LSFNGEVQTEERADGNADSHGLDMSTVAALVAELSGLPQSRVSTDIVSLRQQVSQEITFLDGTVSMFSRVAARIQLKDALVAYLDGNVLYDDVLITSVRPGWRRRLQSSGVAVAFTVSSSSTIASFFTQIDLVPLLVAAINSGGSAIPQLDPTRVSVSDPEMHTQVTFNVVVPQHSVDTIVGMETTITRDLLDQLNFATGDSTAAAADEERSDSSNTQHPQIILQEQTETDYSAAEKQAMLQLLMIIASASVGCAVVCFCCIRIAAHERPVKLEQHDPGLRGYTKKEWQAPEKSAAAMEEGFAPRPPPRPQATIRRSNESPSPRQNRGQLARVEHDLGQLATTGHAAKLNLKRPKGHQLREQLPSTRLQNVHRHNRMPAAQPTRNEHHLAARAAPQQQQPVAHNAQRRSQRQHMAHDPRTTVKRDYFSRTQPVARNISAHSRGRNEDAKDNKRPPRELTRKVAY
jgi:hypothetical protein